MSLEMIQIDADSQEWHEPFLGFVPRMVARAAGELLAVHDVIAGHPFDLGAALPQVIERQVARVEFGFAPERWFPTAAPEHPHGELFVRGIRLPTEPFRFPVLAHT